MSFIVYVDRQQEIIYQKAIEVFNDVQSWDAIAQIRNLDVFRQYPMILDFAEVRRMDISYSHMECVGFKIKTEIPMCLRAIVVNDRNRELVESFVAYLGSASMSMKIFDCVENARDWIKVSPDQPGDIMQQVQRSLRNAPLRIPSSLV